MDRAYRNSRTETKGNAIRVMKSFEVSRRAGLLGHAWKSCAEPPPAIHAQTNDSRDNARFETTGYRFTWPLFAGLCHPLLVNMA